MVGQETSLLAVHPHRPALSVRVCAPHVWVGDSGPLMKDVCRSMRGRQVTSLLAALHYDAARLFIARHVLEEVEQHLPRFAAKATGDAAAALDCWRRVYLPYIRVVDVPQWWGAEHLGARRVSASDPDDHPTAQLAVALAPCGVIAEDRDLIDHGFGDQEWLQVTHASANQAYIELWASAVYPPSRAVLELAQGAARLFGRLPQWAQLLLASVLVAFTVWWQHDGRAVRQMDRVRGGAAELARLVGPPLTQIAQDRDRAVKSWDRHEFTASEPRLVGEQIARLLAVASGPLLAVDLARQVRAGGTTLKERTAVVRRVLAATPAFIQVSRGRWELGMPATVEPPNLTPTEIVDWVRRVTLRRAAGMVSVTGS